MTEPRGMSESILAERITKYWRDRGYNVFAYEVQCPIPKGRTYSAVRSQMVGGLPPGYSVKPADPLIVPTKKEHRDVAD